MNESDDRRIKKLFKNFKKIKFKIHNPEWKIEHDGVAITCKIHRVNGCTKVDYFVFVDGRNIPIGEHDSERARYIFNYIYYCPPDDTPVSERLISFGGYSLVLVMVILGVMVVTKLNNDNDKVNQEKAIIANTVNGTSGGNVLNHSTFNISQKSK